MRERQTHPTALHLHVALNHKQTNKRDQAIQPVPRLNPLLVKQGQGRYLLTPRDWGALTK